MTHTYDVDNMGHGADEHAQGVHPGWIEARTVSDVGGGTHHKVA